MLLSPLGACAGGLLLEDIKLPPGFRIELVARVPNAREMALGDRGTLFVGSFAKGEVYAFRPGSRDALVVARGLTRPVGVAFRDGALLVSDDTAGAVYRISYRDR